MARRNTFHSHATRRAKRPIHGRALVVEALGDRTMLSASPLGIPGWGTGPGESHGGVAGPHPFDDQAPRPFAAPDVYDVSSAGKGSNLPEQFDAGSGAMRPVWNDAAPGGPRGGMHGEPGPSAFARMLDDAGYRPVMQTTIIVITFTPVGNDVGYDTQHDPSSDDSGSLPSAAPLSIPALIPPSTPPPAKSYSDLSADRSPPSGGLGNSLQQNLSKAASALGETTDTVARLIAPPAAPNQTTEPDRSSRAESTPSLTARPGVQGLVIAPGGRTLDATSPSTTPTDRARPDSSRSDSGARRADRMDADGDYADGGVVELLSPRGKGAPVMPDKLSDSLAGPKRKRPEETARDLVWEELGKFFDRAGDLVRQALAAGRSPIATQPNVAVASTYDDGGSIELATGAVAPSPAAALRGPVAGLGQMEVTIESGVALFQAFELEASAQKPVAERTAEPAKAAERVPTRDEKAAAADELETAKRSAATLGLGLMLAVPTALGGREPNDTAPVARRTKLPRRHRLA